MIRHRWSASWMRMLTQRLTYRLVPERGFVVRPSMVDPESQLAVGNGIMDGDSIQGAVATKNNNSKLQNYTANSVILGNKTRLWSTDREADKNDKLCKIKSLLLTKCTRRELRQFQGVDDSLQHVDICCRLVTSLMYHSGQTDRSTWQPTVTHTDRDVLLSAW